MDIIVGKVRAAELNRKYLEKSNLRRKAENAVLRAKTDEERAAAQARFDEVEAETEEAFQAWKQASGSTVGRS